MPPILSLCSMLRSTLTITPSQNITYRSLKYIVFSIFREDIKNFNLLDNDIASIGDLVETQQEISLATW